MTKNQNLFLNCAVLLFFITSCSKDEESSTPNPTPTPGIVDCAGVTPKYAANVKPIIDKTCALSGCHAEGSSNGDYTSYAGIKAAADNGRLRSQIISGSMPPSDTNGPKTLSEAEIQQVICWIGEGAKND